MHGRLVKTNWEEIREKAILVNPTFAKVVDKISPGNDLTLYKVTYPYGSTIVDRGIFHLPLEDGSIVPITDSRVSKEIQQDLAYAKNGMPGGLVLKNAYEVFINAGDYVLPVVNAYPGSYIALWKQLDILANYHPVNIFNITAGSRSIFMLPNVSDAMLHKNLIRDYGVAKQPPKELLDQWYIFKTITEHQECSWEVEMIFLSEKWIENTRNDIAWHELQTLYLNAAWQASGFERNQIFYEFALSCALANKKVKIDPYLLGTARHLMSISLGSTPGFKPATDELLAPIKFIQTAYMNSYDLRKYAPILMHSAHFNPYDFNAAPVYYSSKLPTAISFSPRTRKLTSTLLDLIELKYIMDIFIEEIAQRRVHLEDTIIDVISQIDYDYFHSKPDLRENIRSSSRLPEEDRMFSTNLAPQTELPFSYNGSFVRGCIRIKHKQ